MPIGRVRLAAGRRPHATGAERAHGAERTRTIAVVDSQLPNVTEAVGSAAPQLSSTLATKLMATVQRVLVQEGDTVAAGQVLLTLDVRDIDARAEQATGALDAAQAMLGGAERNAVRMRALFADSAAPKAQLDAAEAALSRANAAVASATGGVAGGAGKPQLWRDSRAVPRRGLAATR